jgi:EF-P beta-lysylation protein EpmB
VQIPDWQKELASAIRDPQTLLRRLQLDASQIQGLHSGHGLFPIRVTASYLDRIQPGNPRDPLLLQILPQAAEQLAVGGFTADPVGDQQANAVPGLLHKYRNRALLLTTQACAIHCRYCFRRNFPYQEARADDPAFAAALDYLAQRPEIDEVILSGGDPLSLGDSRLQGLVQHLGEIPHLQTLRIHTRLPVVLPSRVNNELLQTLSQNRLQGVMVVHMNHPREIDHEVGTALQGLRDVGLTLFNQAVLLKGVNDHADVLAELSRQCFRHGVIPYYLHLLDRARGTAHFEVEEDDARALMQVLRQTLPGYLVPQLVREQAGAAHKLPVI